LTLDVERSQFKLFRNAGFESFYAALDGRSQLIDCYIIHGIVEIFWDTTNTLHFSFGEMTITPFDLLY